MKFSESILFFACMLVLLSSSAHADHAHDFSRASEAYNAGDYQTAFHVWSELAEAGDQTAQEMLAAMYVAGKGTQQNYAQAVRWYRKAAEEGSASAQFTLGKMYSEGLGVEKSLEDAYALLLISAANGNLAAKQKQQDLQMELTSEQTERAKEIVFELLKKISN